MKGIRMCHNNFEESEAWKLIVIPSLKNGMVHIISFSVCALQSGAMTSEQK